jgi:uncharacterized membrane protein
VDILIILVISILIIPLALLTSGAIRIVIGLAFVVLFPGYAFVAALFPKRTSLDTIERITLSLGLSIAVVVLIGLLLYYTSWGIQLDTMLVSLLSFILVMSAIAWYRRTRLSPSDRFSFHPSLNLRALSNGWANQRQRDKIVAVIAVVAIAGVVGVLGYVVANAYVGGKYGEFYLLGKEGKAKDYPLAIRLGTQGRVTLVLENHEQESTSYRIRVSLDGEQVQDIGPVNLEPTKRWEEAVSFTPIKTGLSQKLQFLLYKGTDSSFYKELYLWIDVQ